MRRIARHRPSPALAVAFIALLVAVGGAAFASIPGPSGVVKGCYSKSNGSLRVIDSKKGCSKRHERTLRWNQQGVRGDTGDTGATGAPGSARAYAWMQSPGTGGFVAANSKGISAIRHIGTGAYCVTPATGVSFANSAALVTVDYADSSGHNLLAYWYGGNSGCNAGELAVLTFRQGLSGSNAQDAGQSDQVAFFVAVP